MVRVGKIFIPEICHKRCVWKKNLSCGEFFQHGSLSCGEFFPHDRLSCGEVSPHEKCEENLSHRESSPHDKCGAKSVMWKM